MITHNDLVLLLNQGTESQELNMLITVAKKRFVQEHHHRAISQMTNATGYKKDKWKTYVIVDDKRKEIIRNTEEELYASLYEHYSELEKKPKTMEDVFEKLKDYKLNALARSQKTVDEDNRRFNKISTLLRMKSLNDITDRIYEIGSLRAFYQQSLRRLLFVNSFSCSTKSLTSVFAINTVSIIRQDIFL